MWRRERHRAYLSQVILLAEELGYNAIFQNLNNTPGEPDAIIENPKNGKIAIVEVEVTFQQQKSHQKKIANRWRKIQEYRRSGRDAVLLVIGARRRDLISLCKRAETNYNIQINPEEEYGITIFSCVSYNDQNEIRSALLRCLGDD